MGNIRARTVALVGVGLFSVASVAGASTIVQTFSLTQGNVYTAGAYSPYQSFALFDPALGMLQSTVLTFSATKHVDFTLPDPSLGASTTLSYQGSLGGNILDGGVYKGVGFGSLVKGARRARAASAPSTSSRTARSITAR